MPDTPSGFLPEANRRKHVRFRPSECTIFLSRSGGAIRRLFGGPSSKENLAVGVYDISESGIRLSVRERLPGGAKVVVRFSVKKFNDEVALDGAIVWCSQHAYRQDSFMVGIHFGGADAASRTKIAAMRSYFTSPQYKQKSDTRARLNPASDLSKLEFNGDQNRE